MNSKQKQALRDAIDRITDSGIELGASSNTDYASKTDSKDRLYASVALAGRKNGKAPSSQFDAQNIVAGKYGLTFAQAQKIDAVAASTHNLIQRGQRVRGFIEKVLEQPNYIGRPSRATNGAVSRSL